MPMPPPGRSTPRIVDRPPSGHRSSSRSQPSSSTATSSSKRNSMDSDPVPPSSSHHVGLLPPYQALVAQARGPRSRSPPPVHLAFARRGLSDWPPRRTNLQQARHRQSCSFAAFPDLLLRPLVRRRSTAASGDRHGGKWSSLVIACVNCCRCCVRVDPAPPAHAQRARGRTTTRIRHCLKPRSGRASLANGHRPLVSRCKKFVMSEALFVSS